MILNNNNKMLYNIHQLSCSFTTKTAREELLLGEKVENVIVTGASGGVGSLEHLYEGLYEAGANAVLAASIFHFADYSIQEAKKFLREKNVEVRI